EAGRPTQASSNRRPGRANRVLSGAASWRSDESHAHLPRIWRSVGPPLERHAILEQGRGCATGRIKAQHDKEQTHTVRDISPCFEPTLAGLS
ncbi:MAG: hypothetical protein ACLP8S_12880, partial [Solirubrobacteraceae bacterium]